MRSHFSLPLFPSARSSRRGGSRFNGSGDYFRRSADRHVDSRSGGGGPRVARRSRAGAGSDDDFLDGPSL